MAARARLRSEQLNDREKSTPAVALKLTKIHMAKRVRKKLFRKKQRKFALEHKKNFKGLGKNSNQLSTVDLSSFSCNS